jgi:hypothetical protein
MGSLAVVQGAVATVAQIDLAVGFVAAGCLIVGIGLAVATWRLWVSAAPESPALAPLEIMSEAPYLLADESARAALVDAVRPGPGTPLPQKLSPEKLERQRAKRQQREAKRAAKAAPPPASPAAQPTRVVRAHGAQPAAPTEPRVRRAPVSISTEVRRTSRDQRDDDSGGRSSIDPLLR